MKSALIYILMLFAIDAYAQVLTDTGIVARYSKALERIGPANQLKLNDSMPSVGLALYSVLAIDTLNKGDKIVSTGAIVIKDIENQAGAIAELTAKKPEPYIDIIKASLTNSKLTLTLGGPFSPYTTLVVLNNKAKGAYHEYDKYDSMFRKKLSSPKTNQLDVPMSSLTVKLNKTNFKPGQVVYGEVNFVTAAYLAYDNGFKTGYIQKRVHSAFLFRAIIDTAK